MLLEQTRACKAPLLPNSRPSMQESCHTGSLLRFNLLPLRTFSVPLAPAITCVVAASRLIAQVAPNDSARRHSGCEDGSCSSGMTRVNTSRTPASTYRVDGTWDRRWRAVVRGALGRATAVLACLQGAWNHAGSLCRTDRLPKVANNHNQVHLSLSPLTFCRSCASACRTSQFWNTSSPPGRAAGGDRSAAITALCTRISTCGGRGTHR